MKNFLILIVTTTILFGCNTSLDKSIVKPLSPKELNNTFKEKPSFEKIYRYIDVTRNENLQSKIDKAKYIDVTYNQFREFVNFAADSSYFNEIHSINNEKWNSEFGTLDKKIDSVVSYWKNKEDPPTSVLRYLDFEENNKDDKVYLYFENNPFRKEVSNDLFDENYINKVNFISNRIDEILEKKFPLCFKFKELNSFDFDILKINSIK